MAEKRLKGVFNITVLCQIICVVQMLLFLYNWSKSSDMAHCCQHIISQFEMYLICIYLSLYWSPIGKHDNFYFSKHNKLFKSFTSFFVMSDDESDYCTQVGNYFLLISSILCNDAYFVIQVKRFMLRHINYLYSNSYTHLFSVYYEESYFFFVQQTQKWQKFVFQFIKEYANIRFFFLHCSFSMYIPGNGASFAQTC